jgi:hypothetical protein
MGMEAPQAIERVNVDFFFRERVLTGVTGRTSLRDGHPYRIIIVLNNIYHVPPKKNLSTTVCLLGLIWLTESTADWFFMRKNTAG